MTCDDDHARRAEAARREGRGSFAAPFASVLSSSRLALVLVAVVGAAAVLVAALNADKLAAMAGHAANASPGWLALAVLSQGGAFLCTALAWRRVLRRLREPVSLAALYPLSIAKLFADQALPSGGLSGAAFLMHALKRRGVSWDNAYTAFLFGAATFIAAFVFSAFVSFIAIAGADDTPAIVAVAAKAFSALVIIVILAVAAAALFRWTQAPRFVARIPGAHRLVVMSQNAARLIISEKALFARVVWIQIIQRLFDALTLWLVFQAIDAPTTFVSCFIGVTLASVAATVAPTPMGVGAFKAGLFAALAVFGTPVETGLAAALIYRGLSLWLPLIPGFFVMQRELLSQRKSAGPQERAGPIASM